MKRSILSVLAVLALFTGFALAQSASSQGQQDPSQQPSTKPDTQQMPQGQSQSPTGAGGQSVQSQIQQQPELSGVTVTEGADKIELSGTVATQADKEKAKSIAESAAGGRKVENHIKVESKDAAAPPK